jgi:hypothetical protein
MSTARNLLASAFVGLVILGSGNVKADFTFGNPVKVALGLGVQDRIDCLSYDGLEMYIAAYSYLPGGQGTADIDICVLRRASKDDDWGPPENLGPAVNSANFDILSSISADGLTLYFCSDRLYGDDEHYDIFVSTRATRGDPWGQAVNAGPTINGPGGVNFGGAWISPDGLELYIASLGTRPGGYGAKDLWVAQRATTSDSWAEPVNLGPAVNTQYGDTFCSLSPDGRLLLFSPNYNSAPLRPVGYGGPDLWMARRASLSDPWQAPVNLGPQVNGPAVDIQPRISPDGRTLYFLSNRGGSYYAWEAPIAPVVDFNGDGKVDGKEVLAMAEHWGENYPPCDIAPFAWGDGVVDANDLMVLAEYIGQDVNDPTLIARWTLDETAGMTAADGVGGNDAMVLGNAAWQPQGGKIGGALAFDGKDDFARSGKCVLDPAKGPLSVIAWVKGGAPNRVIVSQSSGADWLYLNLYGMLATDLKSSGEDSQSLTSDAHVLDDQWHRVVMTWDGTYRTLQMDGVEVARDTQPDLAPSSGVLQMGAGKALAPGGFWSGLIDDVRIYNRAVQP